MTGVDPAATAFVEENIRALATLPVDAALDAVRMIDDARQRGARVFVVGNGGSAGTASHLACDLMKAAQREGRPPVRIQCLADCVPAITAWANDESFDVIFTAQLKVHGEPGDVLIAITGSGRSPNIVDALEYARGAGIHTMGLLGMGGGPALDLCDVAIVVDSDDYEVIENAHMVIGHLFAAHLRTHGERSS